MTSRARRTRERSEAPVAGLDTALKTRFREHPGERHGLEEFGLRAPDPAAHALDQLCRLSVSPTPSSGVVDHAAVGCSMISSSVGE
jgi:hypothetical protein